MDTKSVITKFYTAFQLLDYKTMQSCYADDVVFSDPGFGLLDQGKPQAMWQMLCTNAKDFHLSFDNIELIDDEYATCQWTAKYTFASTGNAVTNHIKAYIRVQDGKITEHTDSFNFYKWCKQALGLSGLLLGWTGFMQRKVRAGALKKLEKFMRDNNA